MARFTVTLTAPITAAEMWRRVWNLDAHTEVIPFTRLRGDGVGPGASLRAGSCFVARTGVGPLGIDDVMEVRRFDPPTRSRPGQAHLDKTGRVIGGDIDVRVENDTSGSSGPRSTLAWQQNIRLVGVPALADPIVGFVARLAYRHVLGRLLARHDAP